MTREIDRRSFVKTAAGTAVAATTLATAPNVFAASNKSITFTESWIPNGGSQWVRVAIANGYFKKRGIDVKSAAVSAPSHRHRPSVRANSTSASPPRRPLFFRSSRA